MIIWAVWPLQTAVWCLLQINTSTCEVSEDAFTLDSFHPVYKRLSLHTEDTKCKIKNNVALKEGILELLFSLRNILLKKILNALLVSIIMCQHDNKPDDDLHFYSRKENNVVKTNYTAQNSSTHLWMLQNIHNILGCICQVSRLFLNVCYSCSFVDLLYVREHLADIVLWIKLEEFPLLGGFKAIFLQLISAECSFLKVFRNVRSYDIREQTLSCNCRRTSSVTPVGNVWFQFETFQVRNQQLRDHGTDSNKLPAGECQPGGPSPPTFVMSAWSTFTGEFRHPVSPPPQTLHQPGQNTHDSLQKKK